MNYEKAYKEALEKAEEIIKYYKEHNRDEAAIEDLKEIFPELKENEDEKIRKAIVAHIKDMRCYYIYYGVTPDEMIAWLEKQNHDGKKWIYEDVYLKEKEQLIQDGIDEVLENPQKYGLEKQDKKPQGKTAMEAIKEEKVDNANKIEPKFKEGDFIVNKDGNAYKVVDICDAIENEYCLRRLSDNGFVLASVSVVDRQSRLWSIQDAKEGDILVASDESVFIFGGIKDNCAYSHFSLCKNGSMEISDGKHSWETASSCHPATKEQRDALFAAMKEAGYEWDAEKKELGKIENIQVLSNSLNIGKNEWSSEDERIRKALLEYFGEECDTATINGIYCYKICEWLEKQGEKPQVDGFDAELNALLKKYEHLPKEEIAECLQFYLGVAQDNECDDEIVEAMKNASIFDLVGEQKPKWTEEDERGSDETIELLEYFNNYAPESRRPAIRRSIDWLNSLKQRMEELQ